MQVWSSNRFQVFNQVWLTVTLYWPSELVSDVDSVGNCDLLMDFNIVFTHHQHQYCVQLKNGILASERMSVYKIYPQESPLSVQNIRIWGYLFYWRLEVPTYGTLELQSFRFASLLAVEMERFVVYFD